MTPKEIERRLLELAYTTELEITAPALAYFAPCTIDEADAVLSDLTARDRLHMDISDEGAISYKLIGRPAKPTVTKALVREVPSLPALRAPDASPFVAAALSLFIPGAGHLYAGRPISAIFWFFLVSMGYLLVLPGLLFHMFAIASAANAARHTNLQISRATRIPSRAALTMPPA
ncbi:MAG: hypothetical protein QM831_24400 [Kofleriaceae bacterium]